MFHLAVLIPDADAFDNPKGKQSPHSDHWPVPPEWKSPIHARSSYVGCTHGRKARSVVSRVAGFGLFTGNGGFRTTEPPNAFSSSLA